MSAGLSTSRGKTGSCVDPHISFLPSAAAGTTYCPQRTALVNILPSTPVASPSATAGFPTMTLSYNRVCPRTSLRLETSLIPAILFTPAPTQAITALNSPDDANAWISSTRWCTQVAPFAEALSPPPIPLALTALRQPSQSPCRYKGASNANAPRIRTPVGRSSTCMRVLRTSRFSRFPS